MLVADTTGFNPNVMFELGYAEALNKLIICLHQHGHDNPFDIADLRQVRYELPVSGEMESRVVKAILAALKLC